MPLTGLLFASFRVTAMVDVVAPSATTDVGLALTVEVPELSPPEEILNELLVPAVTPLLAAANV